MYIVALVIEKNKYIFKSNVVFSVESKPQNPVAWNLLIMINWPYFLLIGK